VAVGILLRVGDNDGAIELLGVSDASGPRLGEGMSLGIDDGDSDGLCDNVVGIEVALGSLEGVPDGNIVGSSDGDVLGGKVDCV
jgi:hypothetical protein